jgi:large repetitive protein
MWARRAISALLAVLTLAACGGSDLPAPVPTSMTPARGFAANATPVQIQGDGFAVRTVQSSTGGAPTVDETFQAWLGDVPLQDVRRVDGQTLSATVPAGLAPGVKPLRVQGPFGTSGTLQNAFTVEGSALASMSATISATPATVSVGQSITVRLTVTNGGTSEATGVAPISIAVSGTGAVGAHTGPDPATIASLAPGASGTFTWTYPTTGAGTLSFSGSASATDGFSGTTITAATDPALPAQVTVERPAALTATLPASGAAAVAREFTVTVTVANSGGAAANGVVPAVPTVAPAGRVALKPGTGAVPPSAASLAPGASTTFTFTFVAGTTPGPVTFSSSASGIDANSGATVTSAVATSGPFTIGSAGMNATLTPAPATVSSGQAFTLTLSVNNPGLASVTGFSVGAPVGSSTDGATVTQTSTPSVPVPSTLAAGQTFTTSWTVTAAPGTGLSTGNLSFVVAVNGTDAFSGGALTARPTASVAIQAPAGLTATLTPGRTPPFPAGSTVFPVNVGQPFTLSLSVVNVGAAAANAVTPTAIAGCTSVSPTSAPIPPGPTPVVFLYSGCSSATPGTHTFSASASGTDANNPALTVASNTASASVTVQAPAAVTGTLSIPSAIARGFPFTVTLTLSNTGGAAAVVAPGALAIAAGSTGAATASSGPSPASVTVPAGGTGLVQWTYNATSVGAISFTGAATGTDSNTGASLPAIAVTASNVGSIGQGGLSVSISPSRATATIGQPVVFTMTVTNTGTAPVTNVTPVLGLAPTPGTLGAPSPASIATLGTTAPGNTGTFTWTLTTTSAAGVTATASATGTDALSLAQVSASTVVAGIVQVQATLGGTITGLTGTGLQLATAGEPNLAVAANATSFTFANTLSSGTAYAVTVAAQPTNPSQTCTVTSGGAGTIGTANVASVAVTCVTSTFTVGGTLTGLASGASVVLQNNGGSNLTLAANGPFTFTTRIASGSAYSVTVLTQPANPSQICTVTAGTGTVAAANVTNVAVNCVTNSFTVGGTLTGLAAGASVVLQNNGGNNLTLAANGLFTFTTRIASGGAYAVTVLTQPTSPIQTCTVTFGTGTVAAANVTNVAVNCVTSAFTVGGTLTGLAAGATVVLQNNAGNNLTVAANGAFTFATPIASGGTYSVTVLTQPSTTTQLCTVTNGSGTVASANVTSVSVNCVAAFTVGGTVTGLSPSGTVVLQNNGGDALSVSSAGAFTFSTPLVTGAPYLVTILTQPTTGNQTCSIAPGTGTGTIVATDVASVVVTCL